MIHRARGVLEQNALQIGRAAIDTVPRSVDREIGDRDRSDEWTLH
jgi:hypothetical protein